MDFRNYKLLNIAFDENTNLIYGDNAQGKTNILEAIYVAATTKSHKGNKDREIIRFDCEESHIKAFIDKKGITYRIDMHLKKNKTKGIAINGLPIKKAMDLFGIINIVLFSPEDLNIIKDGPAQRRRFVDMELCQLNKVYLYNLSNYNKVLNQRNKLLKDIHFGAKEDTLDIWDMQLVKYGSEVIKQRKIFIRELNKIVYDIHKKLSGGTEELVIEYEPCTDEKDFEENIIRSREKDLRFKNTNYGPHKDDICFYINGNDIRKYGSQGQQRTSALSLKLAEIELVKKLINDSPILLLDDVLSELDSKRQNYLLDSINDVQTIITCTGVDDFVNNRFSINKVYKVTAGSVICEN